MRLRVCWWWPRARSRRAPAAGAAPAVPAAAPSAPSSEQSAAGLTLAEATELLDLLERRGLDVRAVEVSSDGRVTVHWVGPPPGAPPARDSAGDPAS